MTLVVRGFEAKAFRSLKAITYALSRLDVLVGPNGTGKTNLYRALELLQSAARNRLAHDLAAQGGLASSLWAGARRRTEPARLTLAVDLAEGPPDDPQAAIYRYEVEVGFPQPVTSPAFPAEAQIKTEVISYTSASGRSRRPRTVRLVERQGPAVMARNIDGRPEPIDMDLLASETMLGRLEDPARFPELDAVRRTLLQWRFYHGFRTDAASPLRQPCPAVATPTLASDGADLAAVFATLAHIRQDTVDLDIAIDKAVPGARLVVPSPGRTASFGLSFPDFPGRIFAAEELSDGTLRFLALAGALLGYRLPPFLALNEPETSLHPELLAPLARLVVTAAARTQLWLVTHAQPLAEAITATGAGSVRRVCKEAGATQIEGLRRWGEFVRPAADEEDGA